MEHAQPQPVANSNGPAGSDIGERARAYIAKKKEEIVASVRAIFADRIAMYDAIKSFNKRREEALDLDGGADRLSGHFGDFLSAGDGRMGLVQETRPCLRDGQAALADARQQSGSSTARCVTLRRRWWRSPGGGEFLLAASFYCPQ